jgi:hypothetical protein
MSDTSYKISFFVKTNRNIKIINYYKKTVKCVTYTNLNAVIFAVSFYQIVKNQQYKTITKNLSQKFSKKHLLNHEVLGT